MERLEIIDKDNFFEDTFVNFKEVSETLLEEAADYVSRKRRFVFSDKLEGYGWNLELDDQDLLVVNGDAVLGEVVGVVTSPHTGNEGYIYDSIDISSIYWFTEEGVYRQSDHWGECRTCVWHLDGGVPRDSKLRTGFASWSSFHSIN